MAAARPPRSREEAWNSSPRNSSPRASRAWSEDVADAAAADGEDPRRRAPSRAWSEDLASSDDERRPPPPPPRVRHLESLVAWCAGRVDASERASAWGQPRRGDAELVAARRRTLVEARARLAATRSKAAAPARAATSDRVFRVAMRGAAQESEIPNFKGSYLGRFPLVSADFWTSDHLSERSRSVDAFPGTRARGTLTLKRR